MTIWVRILITIVMMVLISFLVGLFWEAMFTKPIPSYISGLIGGLVAVPVWEILEKFKTKSEKAR